MVPIRNNDGDDGNVKKNPLCAFFKLRYKNSYISYLTKKDIFLSETFPVWQPFID